MPRPESTGRRFVRLSDARQRLGMGKTMFREWVAEKHVPFFKIGKRAVACWEDSLIAEMERMAAEGAPCGPQAARLNEAEPEPTRSRTAGRYRGAADDNAA